MEGHQYDCPRSWSNRKDHVTAFHSSDHRSFRYSSIFSVIFLLSNSGVVLQRSSENGVTGLVFSSKKVPNNPKTESQLHKIYFGSSLDFGIR